MKTRLIIFTIIVAFCSLSLHAQLRLKDKLKKAAKSIVEEELGLDEKPASPPNTGQPSNNANSSDVQGKKLTPPDINNLMDLAIDAYENESYSDCRYQIKETLKGIELEIGYMLLDNMPATTRGLPSDESNDQVVSTGIGFVGMLVAREYGDNNKQVTATIGNNSSYGASYSVLANSAYASNNENQKSITVQGYRGTLTFDGANTYQLGIPFAQSSVFVLNCEGFSGEDEVMTTASDFDIARYEKLLMDKESDTDESRTAGDYLNTARSSYGSKDLEGARYALQRSLMEVDVIIGKVVLGMLPATLAGLSYAPEEDEHVAEAMGFAGIYINRRYRSEDGTTTVNITMMDDSPLMAMVSTFLSSPLMAMTGNKSIKVDGYRGMFEAVEGSDPEEYNINIPNNNSLLTMNFKNISESQVNQAANQVPVGRIFGFTK